MYTLFIFCFRLILILYEVNLLCFAAKGNIPSLDKWGRCWYYGFHDVWLFLCVGWFRLKSDCCRIYVIKLCSVWTIMNPYNTHSYYLNTFQIYTFAKLTYQNGALTTIQITFHPPPPHYHLLLVHPIGRASFVVSFKTKKEWCKIEVLLYD